jgi:hypothetical protein
MLQARKHTPTPCPSVIFTFGLTIESIKEFRGVSYTKKNYDNGRSKDQSAFTLFQIQLDEFANLEAHKYLKL